MIDIASILQSNERVNIEVKAAGKGIPNSIWETYSSFANTFGGAIILGIEENKDTKEFIPIGVHNPQQMLSDIWNMLNNHQKISNNILLEHHVYSARHKDMDFIVIEVPRADRRDKPVYVGQDMFKGTFKRNHEGDYHCSAEEVKAMLRDQADTPQDALLLENLLIDDLNQESVHRYRILFNNLKPDHVWGKLADDEFLIKIGAAKKSREDGKIHPTLGGLIFFGDFITITEELPNYFLDYRERLSNETRWSDRVCSGDGLCDVYSNWETNGFKKPELQETVDPDRITLTLEIEIDSNRESNESNDDSNLTENEVKVIEVLHKNSSLNATQVAAETGLSVSTVNRIYKSLKNKNYIARESLTRGKWIILK